MNRRHFLVLSASAASLALSACKDSSLADKFVGFWVDDTKKPTYVKISREGESFLLDIKVWDMVFKGGYITRRLTGAIDDKANNTLAIQGGLNMILSESGDKLYANKSTLKRMTEGGYITAVAAIDAQNEPKL